jgi:hypothetical protein
MGRKQTFFGGTTAVTALAILAGSVPADAANRTPRSVKPLRGAPPHSCAARPHARDCPTVRKIVRVARTAIETDDSSRVGMVPIDEAATASSKGARRPIARAANHYPGFQCGTEAFYPFNYTYPSGNIVARATGQFDCHSTPKLITYMELYVSLKRYFGGVWDTLNTNRFERFSPGSLSGRAQYDCNHSKAYTYRSETFAYDVADGVGYAGSARRDMPLTCPT